MTMAPGRARNLWGVIVLLVLAALVVLDRFDSVDGDAGGVAHEVDTQRVQRLARLASQQPRVDQAYRGLAGEYASAVAEFHLLAAEAPAPVSVKRKMETIIRSLENVRIERLVVGRANEVGAHLYEVPIDLQLLFGADVAVWDLLAELGHPTRGCRWEELDISATLESRTVSMAGSLMCQYVEAQE